MRTLTYRHRKILVKFKIHIALFLKTKTLVDSTVTPFSRLELFCIFVLLIILAFFSYGLYSHQEFFPYYFATFCRVCLTSIILFRRWIQIKELYSFHTEYKHLFSLDTAESVCVTVNFAFKVGKIVVNAGGSAAAVGGLVFMTYKVYDMDQSLIKSNHENDVIKSKNAEMAAEITAKNAELAAKDAQIREYQRAGEYPKVKTPPLSSEAMDKLVKDILNNSKKK